MCGDAPSPPAGGLPDGGLPGGVPTGPAGGTGLCCACPANGDVSTDGFSNYFSTTYGTSDAVVNKCRISIVRTEDGGSVTITKSFSLSYENGANETDHKGKVTAALTSAISAWQSGASNIRLLIEQAGCKPQKLSILYVAAFPASGANVAVKVNGQPTPVLPAPDLRMSVSGGTSMKFYVNKRGNATWSATHEIGHAFGLEDEYIYTHPTASPAPSITYKAASGPDRTVTLTSDPGSSENGKHAFINASVMGTSGNNTFPDYLYFWVAIEVKKILQAAGATAVVKIVAP